MKLIKKKPNDKCDACGEKADERFTFLIGKERISVCKPCVAKIYRLLGEKLVPKSYETIGVKNKREGKEVGQTIR